MPFDRSLLVSISLVCAQVLFYEVSMKRALASYWFLGLFYLLVFSSVQGLVILFRYFSISFFLFPPMCLLFLFFLSTGLKGGPQFKKKTFTLPNFYLLSGLWLALVWAGYLAGQKVFTAKYNFLEGFVWSWFAAVLFPILAGIKERLELTALPVGFSRTGIFLIAAGFILLGLSFF